MTPPCGPYDQRKSSQDRDQDVLQAFTRFQKEGRPTDLAIVFDATAPELLRVAHHLAHGMDLADDLVQATFLIAIQDRHKYDGRSPVMSWLLGILINRARAAWKVERRYQSLPETDDLEAGFGLVGLGRAKYEEGLTHQEGQPARERMQVQARAESRAREAGAQAGAWGNPYQVLQGEELSSAVTQAIAKLPETYQPVLSLHLRYGLQPIEIALNLHRSAGTVRTQLKRGLEMLRRALPTSLIAGTVVLTAPAHGMADLREVVLSKAAAVTAAGKAAKASSFLFGLGKKSTLLLSAGTFVAVAFGVAVLVGSGDGAVGYAVGGDHATGIATLDVARGGNQDMVTINAESNSLSAFHSPPPQVAVSSQPSDPKRITAMHPRTLASFSSPQPSTVPEPVPMHTLSTLVLSTTLLFPVLLPSQSPIYYFKGGNTLDLLGRSVSLAGDVNLDGYPDIMAGAPGWDDPADIGKTNHGRVYVYSGKDGTLLHTYQGEQMDTELGVSVSTAGDVNLDGYPDLVTGASNDPWTWKGRMYVISGKDASLLFTANGENNGDQFSISVSSASDVNLDGYPDLLTGAPGWDDPNGGSDREGRMYVYSGKDGTLILTYEGERDRTYLGWSVSSTDVNQDGYPDLLAGAPFWDDFNQSNDINRGRVYVISGKDGTTIITFEGAGYLHTNGNTYGENLGIAVGGSGDVNLDGYPDLVAGAPTWHDSNGPVFHRGRVYVISGIHGTLLLTYQGEQAGTNLGTSVSQAQDVNFDGYPDLVAGAGNWDDLNLGTSTSHGRMYVISGKDASLLFTANGENSGAELGGSSLDSGPGVGSAGDVNMDGYPDLLAGSHGWEDQGNIYTGRVYVYSGTLLTLTSDAHLLSISQASTQNLSLSAGASHAGRKYWVFGNFAVNGTSPGVTLGPVNIPLNPDPWTQVTIDFANTAALFQTKGTLDGSGQASASLNSLAPQPAAPLGLTIQHCYLVYQSGPPDAYHMASNLVPWTTVP